VVNIVDCCRLDEKLLHISVLLTIVLIFMSCLLCLAEVAFSTGVVNVSGDLEDIGALNTCKCWVD